MAEEIDALSSAPIGLAVEAGALAAKLDAWRNAMLKRDHLRPLDLAVFDEVRRVCAFLRSIHDRNPLKDVAAMDAAEARREAEGGR